MVAFANGLETGQDSQTFVRTFGLREHHIDVGADQLLEFARHRGESFVNDIESVEWEGSRSRRRIHAKDVLVLVLLDDGRIRCEELFELVNAIDDENVER